MYLISQGKLVSLREFVSEKELINKAKEFATSKHEGQFRKFGKVAYITHPANVAEIVDKFGGSPEMVAAAWLHDVVEESNVSLDEIKKLFGENVASLVKELTNPTDLDKSKKGQYLLDKMNTMSSDALTIKLADRLSNVSDFATAKPSFVQKYAPETKFIIDGLEEHERPLTPQQTKLIGEIRKAIEPYENN